MSANFRFGLTGAFAIMLYFLATLLPSSTSDFGGSVASAAYTAGKLTSCFTCHVQKKKAGYTDSVQWHKDHSKVQNSCPGCHGGKPWSKSKDAAHAEMRNKPMTDTASSCGSCHMEGIPDKSKDYNTSSIDQEVRTAQLISM
ncbi:MAG: hypothetical protein OEY64_03500 [Nitrospinota bacterium]|nr:hypothetical protein [Nitrospinota bacterium]